MTLATLSTRGRATGTVDFSLEFLKSRPLLACLPPVAVARVAQECRMLSVERRAPLMCRDAQVDWLGFLVSGKAQMSCESSDGREVGLRILCEGDPFGELSVLDGRPQVADIVALTNVRVARIPGQVVREALETYPVLGVQFLRHCASIIRHMTAMRIVQSHPHAVARLCALLRLLAADSPYRDVIATVPTHHQMALMLNTSRETVCRTIRLLRTRGLIALRGTQLRIIDVQALEEVCTGNHMEVPSTPGRYVPEVISA